MSSERSTSRCRRCSSRSSSGWDIVSFDELFGAAEVAEKGTKTFLFRAAKNKK